MWRLPASLQALERGGANGQVDRGATVPDKGDQGKSGRSVLGTSAA